MNIAITLVAAMLAGAGFVLQQHAAEQAPQSYFLRLRLITTLLHRPRWLAGVIHVSAGMLLLQGAGLAALILGVILVARAPVLSRLGRPASLLRAAGLPGRPVPSRPRAGS